MVTAPVRPRAYSAWLAEVTATGPAPADGRRHALCLFGGAAMLFTRWTPAILAPELCNRQTFSEYSTDIWGQIADSTHLVVVRDCDVAAVWKDRNAIEDALRDVHVILIFREEAPRTPAHALFFPR